MDAARRKAVAVRSDVEAEERVGERLIASPGGCEEVFCPLPFVGLLDMGLLDFTFECTLLS